MRRAGLVFFALISTAVAEPRIKQSFYLVNLSVDGKHALLQELTNGRDVLHYRVIEVDTKKIEADVELPAIASLPMETLNDGGGEKHGVKLDLANPALAKDLRVALQVLAKFPFGAGNRVAAQPDGAVVAFNVGDYIYTSNNGKIGKRLANQASYAPWIMPDGASIMFRMENGLYPNSPIGRYEMYYSPLDGGAPPQRIAGTAGATDYWTIAKTGDVRILTTQETAKGQHACIVEVNLVKPFRAVTKACLPDDERMVSGILSTRGTWAAFTTTKELDEIDPNAHTYVNNKRVPTKKQRFRFRTLDVDHDKVVVDDTREPMAAGAIDDNGLVVIERFRTTVIVDPIKKTFEQTPRSLGILSSHFRAPGQLVVERDGTVEVLDPTAGPRTPYVFTKP